MSVQRQLNALLFELQTAQSALAQAKILARSWRTVRDLSPTDRRLLARHAGFDGAEEILEGLAAKKPGFAPAMLLQVLNTARGTDGATVAGILAGLRDPQRRDEAVARGTDLVSEVLRNSLDAEGPQEIVDALGELQSVQRVAPETPEQALAALNALQGEKTARPEVPSPPETSPRVDVEASPVDSHRERPAHSPPPRPAAPAAARTVKPLPKPQSARKAATRPAVSAGWDRLGERPSREQPAGGARGGSVERQPAAPEPSRFDAPAVLAALGAASSAFSRLRVLHREMNGFRGSSMETLRDLLITFPEGWVRRRALAAMIAEGIPSDPQQVLELISGLTGEVDRRWCLGVLAMRGDLKGPVLRRSLDLVVSPAARRRLEAMAGRG